VIPHPKISNIRYGPIAPNGHGSILFDFAGGTHSIREPQDVILVGANDDAAARWIALRYGFLLGGAYERD
jgi:hypothetical protein